MGKGKHGYLDVVSDFLDLTSSPLHWVEVLEAAGSRSGWPCGQDLVRVLLDFLLVCFLLRLPGGRRNITLLLEVH